MKKLIILAFILLIGSVGYAHAQVIPFNYTGAYAVNISGTYESDNGDGGNHPPNVYGNVGGGNDVNGYAAQFILSNNTFINSINSTAIDFPQDTDLAQSTSYAYQIYSGTTFQGHPNNKIPTSLLDTTNSVAFSIPASFTLPSQTEDFQIPVNQELSPGTYWIAVHGGGDLNLLVSQTYSAGSTAVAPEPTSIWLMLLGLAGVLMLKRRFWFGM